MHITSRCNLRCLHCYARKHESELSLPEVHELINESVKLGVSMFHIEGGEPLTYNNILDVVSYIKNRPNAYLELTTNGTLLTEFYVKEFLRRKLDTIVISIDGPNKNVHDAIRGKGNFYKSMRALNLCLKFKLHVGVCFTINSINKDYIKDMINKFQRFDIKFLNFRRFIPT